MRMCLAQCAFWVAVSIGLPSAAAAERYRLDPETYQAAINMSAGHPNERFRWHGLWNYSNGRHAQARKHFERAAHYGDKPAQFLLSVMSRAGEGGQRDPVQAYIWADLAAERGTNSKLLALREQLWAALTPEQQERVREIGPGFYERYGDAVAMERTNRDIARFARSQTGSRAGSSAGKLNLSFGLGSRSPKAQCEPSPRPEYAIAPHDFYAAARTDIDAYWHDQELAMNSIMTGTVRIGNIGVVRDNP